MARSKPKSTRRTHATSVEASAASDNGSRGAPAETAPVAVAKKPTPRRTGSTNNTDDPIRMYLMQMGQIPMLNRDEEVAAAKAIKASRTRFRKNLLATDFVLQGAMKALQQIQNGKLRLDRTIEVSVTNTKEKKNILRRLTPNLKTIRHLLSENSHDYYVAINKRYSKLRRRQAWKKLVIRRNKTVRLIEEMNLRINQLQPLFDNLCEINQRIQAIKKPAGGWAGP